MSPWLEAFAGFCAGVGFGFGCLLPNPIGGIVLCAVVLGSGAVVFSIIQEATVAPLRRP